MGLNRRLPRITRRDGLPDDRFDYSISRTRRQTARQNRSREPPVEKICDHTRLRRIVSGLQERVKAAPLQTPGFDPFGSYSRTPSSFHSTSDARYEALSRDRKGRSAPSSEWPFSRYRTCVAVTTRVDRAMQFGRPASGAGRNRRLPLVECWQTHQSLGIPRASQREIDRRTEARPAD